MKSKSLSNLAVATAVLCLISSQPAHAERTLQTDPYSGVVINETLTVAGQDFYQQFIAAWRDRDLSDRYSIVIHERPSARLGSQIWIDAAQRRLFQAFLPTARAAIKSLSEQAVDIAYQQVTEAEVERLLFRDADLGADEL